jgi:hypothetical protein
MKKTLANLFLVLVAGWLALLDYCLISTAKSALVGQIIVILVLQASIIAFATLLANGALPTVREMATGDASARVKLIATAPPIIFLLFSPFMISDSIYRARYGSSDRITVQGYVVHDLACCLNPLQMVRQ